jgi:hypothetical protein
LPPLFYQFEDLVLDAGRMHRWALGESADKLIEEFFGADLEVEWVAAVLNADI